MARTTYAQMVVKDSFYFMKDGSEFSDEEKDEEAAYIFDRCEENTFQNTYFKCDCIAGAYRNARDSEKLIPQNQLLNSLYSNPNSNCVNSEAIAGKSFQDCYNKVLYARPRDTLKDNTDYCACVANKTANNFKKDPRFNLRHISNIGVESTLFCERKLPRKNK